MNTEQAVMAPEYPVIAAEHPVIAAEHPVLAAFRDAAEHVPAYRALLAEAGVDPRGIRDLDDFRDRVPVIDKQATFGRFSVAQLCRGGRLGRPSGVLTSSGHSGQFAFGLWNDDSTTDELDRADDGLDMLFQVRTKPTLLINSLPMGVKVFTRVCTLGETSVRPDMVIALVRELGPHYEQIILVGETAFVKHVLELGESQGIDWKGMLVHVIVGEEPIAENARTYLQGILGCRADDPQTGVIGSSMGVAELGLNVLFELPPLITLRRQIHKRKMLRRMVLGKSATNVPMIFVCDPRRFFVEILDGGRLVVSTLEPDRRVPLIRYDTGDVASGIGEKAMKMIVKFGGERAKAFAHVPVIMIHGRAKSAMAGAIPVSPEQVKEGLYHDPELARLITANFRLTSGPRDVTVRIQLAPNVENDPRLVKRFTKALSRYVPAPMTVTCQPYEEFRSGMSLDYERKFDYLGN